MRSRRNSLQKEKKGEDIMALMTKPRMSIPIVKADKSKQFIQKSNEKRLTPEILAQFRKSSHMFKRK